MLTCCEYFWTLIHTFVFTVQTVKMITHIAKVCAIYVIIFGYVGSTSYCRVMSANKNISNLSTGLILGGCKYWQFLRQKWWNFQDVVIDMWHQTLNIHRGKSVYLFHFFYLCVLKEFPWLYTMLLWNFTFYHFTYMN